MRANRRWEGARSCGGNILEIVPVAWASGRTAAEPGLSDDALTMRSRFGDGWCWRGGSSAINDADSCGSSPVWNATPLNPASHSAPMPRSLRGS
jgi:hypothetical protein